MSASLGQLIEGLVMFALSLAGVDSNADAANVAAPPVEIIASIATPAAHIVPVVTVGDTATSCEASAGTYPTVEIFTVRDLRPIRPWAS